LNLRNADGTYTATITNNTVETVRVSAAFDGSDVGNAVDDKSII
jgi:hypothetical protein